MEDKKESETVYRRMAEKQFWVDPTLAVFAHSVESGVRDYEADARKRYFFPAIWITWDPKLGIRTPPQGRALELRRISVKHWQEATLAAHKAGVPMILGTDCGANNNYVFPGWSVHEELEELVKAGLTPAEALRMATVNAARWRGESDTQGTVDRGKVADLLILRSNPLEAIRHTQEIDAVFKGGKRYARTDLDGMLHQVEEKVAAPLFFDIISGQTRMSFLWMTIITLAILQTSVFLTTIYLHRAKTHRGLEIHPALGLLMHIELSLFTGIVPREWVAVHRKHHQFSDEDGDPHSPYQHGMWTVLFANFWFYREAKSDARMVAKYTPDWKEDWLDKVPHMHAAVLGGLGIFIWMFGYLWGAAAWLAHVVGYILLNSTINSVCHMVGYRNWDNKATNLQWVALLTGGEGLHNNHHEFPTSARFSWKRFEVDPAWPVIRLLESLRLAKVKKLPAAKAA